jgi:hypothetical protein
MLPPLSLFVKIYQYRYESNLNLLCRYLSSEAVTIWGDWDHYGIRNRSRSTMETDGEA